MSFDNLRDALFEQVDAQVAIGLKVISRQINYLKKIADSQTKYGDDITKHTKHEEERLKLIQGDQMLHHLHAAIQQQDLLLKMAQKHRTMGERTLNDVVRPLEEFYKQAEDKRKKTVSAFNKLSHNIKDLRSKVAKELNKCRKEYEECLKVKKDHDEEEQKETTNPKKFEKLQAKLRKVRESTTKTFQKFESFRDEAIIKVKQYYDVDVPALMKDMNDIELDRLKTLEVYLEHFSKIQQEADAPLAVSSTFGDMVKGLSAADELAQCVQNLTRADGDQSVREELDVVMPCDSAKMQTDKWFQGGDSGPGATLSVPSNSVPDTSISKASTVQSMSESKSVSSGSLEVIALYDYKEDMGEAGDLFFSAGDQIQVSDTGKGPSNLDPTIQGWWTGTLVRTGAIGRFPSNYVKPNTAAAAKPPPPKTRAQSKADLSSMVPQETKLMAKALYDYVYEPCGDPSVDDLGYIAFNVGDMIEVISQEEGEWWYGSLNGKEGYFPANCVELTS